MSVPTDAMLFIIHSSLSFSFSLLDLCKNLFHRVVACAFVYYIVCVFFLLICIFIILFSTV